MRSTSRSVPSSPADWPNASWPRRRPADDHRVVRRRRPTVGRSAPTRNARRSRLPRRGCGTGATWLAASAAPAVVVAHADLPHRARLPRVARDGAQPIVTLVPCHRDDGTPVLSVPPRPSSRFATARRRSAATPPKLAARPRAARRPRPFPRLRRRYPRRSPRTGGRPRADTGAVTADGLAVPGMILAIGAHPDDVEFGMRRDPGQVGRTGGARRTRRSHRRVEGHVGPRRRSRHAK